ncbi:penicillin-binding protein 2 [Patescibacteria group bacterium]|nr:penicillin-binding protein 2 [Patescibacteria group bacterium]
MQRIRKKDNFIDNRLAFLVTVILAFVILLIGKLFIIQIFQHEYYSDIAESQYKIDAELSPNRGEIYLQDYKDESKIYPYATNRKYYLAYANTNEVKYPKDILDKLIDILKIEDEEHQDIILNRLLKVDDVYEPLYKKITTEQKEALEEFELPGIHFIEEVWRYYPENNIGSHLLGFVGYTDNGYQGQYGLEGYFNKELSGESGRMQYHRDVLGRIIPTGDRIYERAEDGFDLVLTIDRALQFQTCNLLAKHAVKYGAATGTVIIMEPNTGAIMAMCSYPDFNPNEYNMVETVEVYNNPAIFTAYEPGSVFKALTIAAAIDQDKVEPNTLFTDTGSVEIGKYTIKNAQEKVYGEQTITQILEKSINTGAIWIAQQVGINKFRDYMENFGFGKFTGISLNKEVAGNISSLDKKSDVFLATASYGQGLTATPIQLVTAFAALANGGKLMQPYIVDRIVFSSGIEEKNKPVVVNQVISPKTSMTISAMLANVVESGHAKLASVPGYYIGGKTGTAQVASGGTVGYDEVQTIHTFIGFAPVDNPRFVMLTKFDHPSNVEFAASSAAPLFGELAQFILQYLQIPTEK